MTQEQKILFLKEYAELCKKHNMAFVGCGCCGSPFLSEGSPDWEHILEEEGFVDVKKMYEESHGKFTWYDAPEEQREQFIKDALNNIGL